MMISSFKTVFIIQASLIENKLGEFIKEENIIVRANAFTLLPSRSVKYKQSLEAYLELCENGH